MIDGRITPEEARALAADGWTIAGRWSGDQFVLKRHHDGRTVYQTHAVAGLALEVLEKASRVEKKKEET